MPNSDLRLLLFLVNAAIKRNATKISETKKREQKKSEESALSLSLSLSLSRRHNRDLGTQKWPCGLVTLVAAFVSPLSKAERDTFIVFHGSLGSNGKSGGKKEPFGRGS